MPTITFVENTFMNKKRLLLLLIQVVLINCVSFSQTNYALKTINGLSINKIPKELFGNWFEKGGNEIWKLGLYDSVVIYNNCLWHYESIVQKSGSWQINLLPIGNSTLKNTSLELKQDKGGIVLISEKLQNPIACISNPTKKGFNTAPAEKGFPTPFFKQGKAIIQGYVHGFKYVNNKGFNEGNEKPFYLYGLSVASVKTQSDGIFTIELSLAHPQLVGMWITTSDNNGRKSYLYKYFYVEPGRTITSYIAAKDSIKSDVSNMPKQLFMGDDAEISASENCFAELRKTGNTSLSLNNSNKMDYESYKAKYQQNYKDNDDLAITYLTTGKISEKAFKMAHIANQVEYLSSLIRYNRALASHLKAKQSAREDANNQDANGDETKNEETDNLLRINNNNLQLNNGTEKKFTLNDISPMGQFLRDTLSLLSNRYLRLLSSLNELNEFSKTTFNISNIIELMKEKGIVLTPDEERAYLFFKEKKEIATYSKNDIDSLTFYSTIFKEKRKKIVEKFASELEDTQNDGPMFFWLRLPSFASYEKRTSATVNSMNFEVTGKNTVAEVIDSRVYRKVIEDYEDIFAKSKSISKSEKVDSRIGKAPQTEKGDFFPTLMREYRGKMVLIDFLGYLVCSL